MRVGVFGGTFDPVHLGHLIVAEQCREQAGLDRVWFVPAARPPHKRDRQPTAFERRVEMLALAVAGHPAFEVLGLEGERPGPSYTVETLEELRRRHPKAELSLVMGSDMLADLPQWREPARIVELARLLVVARPGWPLDEPDRVAAALGVPHVRHHLVSMPLLEISSSDLRRRVAEGRTIRYLAPRAVECYVEQHGLYRPPA